MRKKKWNFATVVPGITLVPGAYPGIMKIIIWSDMTQKKKRLSISAWTRCCISNYQKKAEKEMNILKSIDENGSDCCRYTYSYPSVAGLGHFIHTYNCNGDPLPTFTGEPHRVNIKDDIEKFANEIWENLNGENKISLYVRYTDIETGKYTDKIINKNGR